MKIWVHHILSALAVSLLALPAVVAQSAVTQGDGLEFKLTPEFEVHGNLRRCDVDGREYLVATEHGVEGWQISIFEDDLRLKRRFTVAAPPGYFPASVRVEDGAQSAKGQYLSRNLFNGDVDFEIAFVGPSSGDILVYNSNGTLLGQPSSLTVRIAPDGSKFLGNERLGEDDGTSEYLRQANELIRSLGRVYNVYGDNAPITSNAAAPDLPWDFGAPAILLALDHCGEDLFRDNNGYNWFSPFQQLEWHHESDYYMSTIPYTFLYGVVMRANNLISLGSEDVTPDTAKTFALSQAYALRAWAYTVMAQMYQHTYLSDPTATGVPLVTESNATQLVTEGISRASLAETYAFILADLDRAITLGCAPSRANDSDYFDQKEAVTLPVAYGLRARANMLTGEWQKAENDALAAIRLAGEMGIAPRGAADIKPCCFISMGAQNYMWGVAATSQRGNSPLAMDHPASFGSWMNVLGNGYATYAPARIDNRLYECIPATDVRKRLFMNSFGTNAWLDESQIMAIERNSPIDDWSYVGLKFDDWYAGGRSTDFPLMRIEEMHLVVAEAKARKGDTDAAREYLAEFVSQWRDPAYGVDPEADTDQLVDMIHQQRRLEFWGEGMAYFDLLRLQKGIDRTGSNWPSAHLINVAPHSPRMIWRLVDGSQINGNPYRNPAIDDETNNPHFND